MPYFALLIYILLSLPTVALSAAPELSAYGGGGGPSVQGDRFLLLDETSAAPQSNAVALQPSQDVAFQSQQLNCRFYALPGTSGGSFLFLNTVHYGIKGPAPFLQDWAEPNLTGSFAVGIDLHNPPSDEPFGKQGNFGNRPQREISLHWNGREITNRLVVTEFRSREVEFLISIEYVLGGAEVSVTVAGEGVYDRYFVPGMLPYRTRLAIGADSRGEASSEFYVAGLDFRGCKPAEKQRSPLHIPLFNHVLTDHEQNSHRRTVTLPSLDWALGRAILTLALHDAGQDWDPWDRNGALYLLAPDGNKYDILPFITSFRTPGVWQADVSHFRPWLTGEVTFEIETTSAGEEGQGFMLSAALDFYHGTSNPEAFQVVPLWHGTARYKSADNHFRDFFAPQAVRIPAETRAAKLFISTSGHSPIGEFTPHHRKVIFVPDRDSGEAERREYANLLWNTDNYLNPVRPQRGSWKYPRAGWAPGDLVQPWQIALTDELRPGKIAEIDYQPQPYDFSDRPQGKRPTAEKVNNAALLVRAYLVLYRSPSEQLPAPMIEVLQVEADSNAAKGGVEKGDWLLKYHGRFIDGIDQLLELIEKGKSSGSSQIEVVLYRDGKRQVVTLDPGRMGVLIAEEGESR